MNDAYINFDEQNFDKLIKSFMIAETLREISLVRKTLTNWWLFVKFIKVLGYTAHTEYTHMHLHTCTYTHICNTFTSQIKGSTVVHN